MHFLQLKHLLETFGAFGEAKDAYFVLGSKTHASEFIYWKNNAYDEYSTDLLKMNFIYLILKYTHDTA